VRKKLLGEECRKCTRTGRRSAVELQRHGHTRLGVLTSGSALFQRLAKPQQHLVRVAPDLGSRDQQHVGCRRVAQEIALRFEDEAGRLHFLMIEAGSMRCSVSGIAKARSGLRRVVDDDECATGFSASNTALLNTAVSVGRMNGRADRDSSAP